jgi:REP-associated tyrosine transposase
MSQSKLPHRKRVRHYHDPGCCHELTFSCYGRRPLLTNDTWRSLLSEEIDRATERHGYMLTAFVFMPEHVHLLAYPGPNASTIDQFLSGFKRPFSFRIKRLLQEVGSPLLNQLTVHQRPGIEAFRFWQEGPGYDRNFDRVETVLAAIDYIHRNPVRRGLVERAIEWPWSSARWSERLPYSEGLRIPCLKKLPAEFLVGAAR